jgi:nucleotide-binding universal stress UspA family protein
VRARWRHEEGDPGSILIQAARTADLTVSAVEASTGIDALAPSIAEQLALGAGGPVLLLPEEPGEGNIGRRVVVGWNGSRESTRAARDALPFLRDAESVTVAAFGDEFAPSAKDAVSMLAAHGVRATTMIDRDQHDAGRRLLTLATGQGADLLVMGAYGRPRLREMILGGATRDILRTTKLPVLLSS